jgi:2-amino-4-hydroxy-6-hydroxymethyldihydropteridine diphosphokinase
MALVYLSLGSNLGNKEEYLRQATAEIEKQIGPVVARSAFFASEPWGFQSSHFFLNACVACETALSPQDCLILLSGIERATGRIKNASKGYQDRTLDLDILFYGNLILKEENLVIPHPLLHQRLFVLNPLSEIAPDFIHPVLGETIDELQKKELQKKELRKKLIQV